MSATASPVDLIGSSRAAIAANVLTISRFLLAPILALMILDKNPSWVTFTLGLAMGATDFFDGKLARYARPTKFGAFFDPLADKLVVLLAGFALVEIGRFPMWPMVLILIREVGIQAYRSYWSRRGLAIPARRSAKYKVFIQGIAIAAAMLPLLDGALWVADTLLYLAVVFTVVTAVQYLVDGQRAMSTTGTRPS